MKNIFQSKIGFILCTLLFTLTYSCNPEPDLVPQKKDNTHTYLASSTNNCNDLALLGVLHGEGVKYVMSHQEEMDALSNDEMALNAFIVEKTVDFLGMIEIEGTTYDESNNTDWHTLFDHNVFDYHAILEQSALTDYEKEVLTNYFDQFSDSDIETKDGIQAFIAFTENLECSLAEDPNIIHQTAVFASTAITKNSLELWTTYSNNGGGGIDSSQKRKDVVIADGISIHIIVGGPFPILGYSIIGSTFGASQYIYYL
jgi:hypothetical protein